MSQQNLAELRAQARMTYRYWHIYLMLRLREIEQHLAPEERATLSLPAPTAKPDARILHEAGLLPEGASLAEISMLTIPEATHHSFLVQPQWDGTHTLLAQADDHTLPLMRVPAEHHATLNDACERFNALLLQHDAQAIFHWHKHGQSRRVHVALNGNLPTTHRHPTHQLCPNADGDADASVNRVSRRIYREKIPCPKH
jgi:hypothetical protein